MTRARLISLRLGVTLALLVVLFVIVRQLWFPGGFFQIFGVAKLYLVVAIGAVIAGPGLSGLVFKPGKKGLKFDLVVLALIEIAILGWGMYELSERRPVYAVFAVDRFEAVAAREIDPTQIRYAELADWPKVGPRLVYAELPTDPDVMNRLIDETVFYGMADIDRRPEFWRPYPQGMEKLKAAGNPLSELLNMADGRADRLRRWLGKQGDAAENFLYLPMRGSNGDGTVVLHADVGYPLAVLPIDPW